MSPRRLSRALLRALIAASVGPVALAAGVAASSASTTSITDTLSNSKASIEITYLPVGTTAIHVAVMQDMAGDGIKYLNISASTKTYTPPSSTPVVDVQAYGSSGPIGSWAGRLQTVPGGTTTTTTTTTTTEERPFTVGVDTGGWGGSLLTELIAAGIGEFRVQQAAASWIPAGHIASVIFGESGSIGGINPETYRGEITKVVGATHPLAIEVLNEPGGSWFWSDPTNYSAYTRLAKAAHEAVSGFSPRPAVLCSWDGGQNGQDTFGRGIKAAGALAYCDGVTVHPYGGSSGQYGGALGDRANAERAHSESGLPVYVTEVGWPTAVGQPSTGDSQQWTETQQAQNIQGFVGWARATGYVRMVIVFNGVDYGTNDWYGIERQNRTRKPSFQVLAEASR